MSELIRIASEHFKDFDKYQDVTFAMQDFAAEMRGILKHQNEEDWPKADEVVDKFWQHLKDREVDLYD